jgi:cobalt-zinc-cadmium efflux system outer membrane protein
MGFLAVALWSVPAYSQDSGRIELQWEDVVRRVHELPRVQEGILRIRAAEAGVQAVGQVPNPEVEMRAGRGMPRGEGATRVEWGVGLTVPFDWIGSRGFEMRAAKLEADATRQDSLAVRREVLSFLSGLYWKISLEQRLVEVLAETETEVARLAGLTRLRVEKGEERPAGLLRIETELERVRIDLSRARADARADRRRLALALGLPDDVDVGVGVAASAVPDPGERDETSARILGAHPRLAAAHARVRALDASVSAERARRIPGFSLGAFFEREVDKEAAGGVLQVRLPVWNWNTGAIRRAEAEQAAEERAAEAAARDLQADAAAAWENCVQSREAAARLDTEILPRAEAASRAVERGFELGESSLIDVLDARRVLLAVRTEQFKTGFQAHAECMLLRILAGDLDGNQGQDSGPESRRRP